MTHYVKTFSLFVMVDDKGAPVFDRHGQPRTLIFDPALDTPHGFVKLDDVSVSFTLPPTETIAERWHLSLTSKGTL